MRLPVIVERNAWTLPQERYNADWILEKQVGLVVRGPHQIPAAVKELLRTGKSGALSHQRRRHPQPGGLRNSRHPAPNRGGLPGQPLRSKPEKSLSEQRA